MTSSYNELHPSPRMMVRSKMGSVLTGHDATVFSNRQSHVAGSLHALHGRYDSSHESDFWWYELCEHSPRGLLSVRDSGGDHHVGSPLTLPGAGWHLPDVVPPRIDVDLLPSSSTLHRSSFKLNQALPTNGANCRSIVSAMPMSMDLGFQKRGWMNSRG